MALLRSSKTRVVVMLSCRLKRSMSSFPPFSFPMIAVSLRKKGRSSDNLTKLEMFSCLPMVAIPRHAESDAMILAALDRITPES